MAITINGSGTITGISTGGLPDGIVDADTLATSSVTSSKILDSTIAIDDINTTSVSSVTDSGWITPTVTPGSYTGPYGPIRYRKDGNVVSIQGITSTGGSVTTSTIFFTLPVGYRPNRQIIVPGINDNSLYRLDIYTSGEIKPITISNGASWFSLYATFIVA